MVNVALNPVLPGVVLPAPPHRTFPSCVHPLVFKYVSSLKWDSVSLFAISPIGTQQSDFYLRLHSTKIFRQFSRIEFFIHLMKICSGHCPYLEGKKKTSKPRQPKTPPKESEQYGALGKREISQLVKFSWDLWSTPVQILFWGLGGLGMKFERMIQHRRVSSGPLRRRTPLVRVSKTWKADAVAVKATAPTHFETTRPCEITTGPVSSLH